MKERVINIIDGIGTFGCSMQYVKYMLDELGGGPITVRVSSLGGDLNHAINIKNMFAEHGDITVEYVGFNASASTILCHGARRSYISSDSFFLIHKPMFWADSWGYFNEDELTSEIEKMQNAKKDAEVVTLSMIREYSVNRGIDISKVTSLIKEARWLSATEAVELGFVDEVRDIKKPLDYLDSQMVAMMRANSLPVPSIEKVSDECMQSEDKSKILSRFLNIFKPNRDIIMETKYSHINAFLNVDSVALKDNSVVFSVEQLELLNSKIGELSDKLSEIEVELSRAKENTDSGSSAMSSLIDKINGLSPAIASIDVVDEKINALHKIVNTPVETPVVATDKESKKDVDSFEDDDDYSFNKSIDNSIF